MERWYPAAIRNEAVRDGGSYIDGVPFRGVLHTTESDTFRPRVDNYGGWHTSYPHFTGVDEGSRCVIYQHIPIDRAARALRNRSGGAQTNRARAVQIEIVGRAAESAQMSPQLLAALADWMRWVEAQTGIGRHHPEFSGSDAYGENGRVRMSSSAWLGFDGWCGHQHVPENDHWDPGRIPIDVLMGGDATSRPPPVLEGKRYRVVGVDGDDVLNVRRDAGPSADVVGVLAPTETGVVTTGQTARVGEAPWVEIEEPLGGWVNARYLDQLSKTLPPGVTYRVAGVTPPDRLNVRAAPGVEFEIVGRLEPETTVGLSGWQATVGVSPWLEIAEPVRGWAHGRYLRSPERRRSAPSAPVPISDPVSHGDVTDEQT